MPEYKFNVRSTNRVRNQLRTLVSAHKEVLDPVTRKWAQETRSFLKRPYPPPPPPPADNPSYKPYKRTGRLGNSFAVRQKGVAWYEIVNTADAGKGPYGSWVIGDDDGDFRQARIHKDRWYQMRPEIEKKLPDLRAAIEAAMKGISS